MPDDLQRVEPASLVTTPLSDIERREWTVELIDPATAIQNSVALDEANGTLKVSLSNQPALIIVDTDRLNIRFIDQMAGRTTIEVSVK